MSYECEAEGSGGYSSDGEPLEPAPTAESAPTSESARTPDASFNRGGGEEGYWGRTRKKEVRVRGLAPGVDAAAREMRHEATLAEMLLWSALRAKQLGGLKFRRQHPVGRFVLDFYCPAHKLAIELDGGSHDGQRARDCARTEQLAAYGYRVLRFRNEEVITRLPHVLGKMLHFVDEIAVPPAPPTAPAPNSSSPRS